MILLYQEIFLPFIDNLGKNKQDSFLKSVMEICSYNCPGVLSTGYLSRA